MQHPRLLPLILIAGGIFLLSAAILLAPSVAGDVTKAWQRVRAEQPVITGSATASPAAAAPQSLTAAEREVVLSYVEGHREDDPLVELRPGIYAKRSNVHGIQLDGRTVYYDIASHQSFGPLRSGKVSERDVDILAREGSPAFPIVIYALKSR